MSFGISRVIPVTPVTGRGWTVWFWSTKLLPPCNLVAFDVSGKSVDGDWIDQPRMEWRGGGGPAHLANASTRVYFGASSLNGAF